MALCDYLITADIKGYDCANPAVKGAESMGLLLNRSDVTVSISNFTATPVLKCGGKKGYKVYQSGKQPWNGTQQEMVEGTYVNTLTNTVQFVILKQDNVTAEEIFALANGEFIAVVPDKQGNYQVYGAEAGLKCSAAVRELYNDDTLSGWLITLTEEGATRSLFCTSTTFNTLQNTTTPCP